MPGLYVAFAIQSKRPQQNEASHEGAAAGRLGRTAKQATRHGLSMQPDALRRPASKPIAASFCWGL